MANPASPPSPHAEIVVDLGAIRHNVSRLRELVSTEGRSPALMVVVKADAYGHGMLAGGARRPRRPGRSGSAWPPARRRSPCGRRGDTGRVLCWLAAPGADFSASGRSADVDVTAYSVAQLDEIVRGAARGRPTGPGAAQGRHRPVPRRRPRGRVARPGHGRAHAPRRTARSAVTGLWSHFACADEPDHPANDGAARRPSTRRCALADDAGLAPEVRHLANSAGALLHPDARHDLVRLGIAGYGLSPRRTWSPSEALGLVPAMTVRGVVVLTKELAAGDGVSYGHTFVAAGADAGGAGADGVRRRHPAARLVDRRGARRRGQGAASWAGSAWTSSSSAPPRRGPATRWCCSVRGLSGEPTATDWARWCGTIYYEIVTRMGGRQTRVWVGDEGED